MLVRLDFAVRRPMLVTRVGLQSIFPRLHEGQVIELRASGTVFCEPDDHNTLALRGKTEAQGDPARFHGRPERYTPYVYAESLSYGDGVGQWRPK